MNNSGNTYELCTHCGRILHRSTVWRHQQSAQRNLAFTNDLGQSEDLPLDSRLSSPEVPSLSSTERALSPLHFSDLGEPNPPASPPLHLAYNRNTPVPDPYPLAPLDDEDVDMEEAQPRFMEDDGRNLNLALIQSVHDGPFIEEPDFEILNRDVPPPRLPTADEIFQLSRFGINHDDEDDTELAEWAEELLRVDEQGEEMDIEDFALPPAELEEELELNAARARLEQGIGENSPEWNAVKTFKYQLEVNLGHNSYHKLRTTFPQLDLPSLQVLRRDVESLASIVCVTYHCCVNSCICFVGAYANRQTCHHCGSARFKSNGKPSKLFHYFPISPQIKAMYAGRTAADQMRYRSRHQNDNFGNEDDTISDVYDSDLYKRLRESAIVVDGHVHPFKFFDDPRDVFVTGMTDGFQLFKKGKHTAWPLLFINNNLAPSIRYQRSNAICVGLIPGPRKPKEHDSFMYVVVQDLAQAALGTRAYDAVANEMFTLRIFGPLKCGDMPAMASAYTGGKHHGAKHPCRMCPIEGIRIRGSDNPQHYLPITRPPGYDPQEYTLDTLPLRTHDQYLEQAAEVDNAATAEDRKQLSQLYGINHTPMTAKIPGIEFPFSFPFEFMHLFENTGSNYVSLIASDFKKLGAGIESYIIPEPEWKQIGLATVQANATIPSCFGRRIPNVAMDRTYMTAEAYLVWVTMYAPILLRDRFAEERYYLHWMKFVSIVERCTAFSITRAELLKLRSDIHDWYTEYERVFYQYDTRRLAACLITIHAWLHLPDMIRRSGPVWGYWTWVMERFCGLLSRAVTSRKYPYASLNRRIREIQTLQSIRNIYDLQDRLPPHIPTYSPDRDRPPSYHDPALYPELTLLHPRRTVTFADQELNDLHRRIAVHLATRYRVTVPIARQAVPAAIVQWGRAHIKDADTISTHCYGRREEDGRDATFIQYELLVDIHTRYRSRRPEFQPETFFGRLDRVFICELPPTPALGITQTTPLILMDIKICNTQKDRYGFYEYSTYRHSEVIDGQAIRALVGRIQDRGKWVIVRRRGVMEHADFDDDDDDDGSNDNND